MMGYSQMFEELGGDYQKLLGRLKNDAMIETFLKIFMKDQEFCKLEMAMQEQRDQDAFSAAHALKGVSANMEFGNLYRASSDLTELLRHGRKPGALEKFTVVKQEYENVINTIQRI